MGKDLCRSTIKVFRALKSAMNPATDRYVHAKGPHEALAGFPEDLSF